MKFFPVHTMNVCEGVTVQLNSFLTLALDIGVWSASCSCNFIPEKGVSSTHCIGDWMGIKKNKKISCLYQDSKPRFSSLLPSHYTHYANGTSVLSINFAFPFLQMGLKTVCSNKQIQCCILSSG
jgi:hypothetical protein